MKSFETYFRLASFAVIASGAFALGMSGGLSAVLGIAFSILMIGAWLLEQTRFQLPERIALIIVLSSVPLFYLDWRYQLAIGDDGEKVGVTALTHLLLFLTTVKLLQKKADRDWVFLYLIAFFEVLLAAGLSFNASFLASLGVYLVSMLATIVAFEIRKSRRLAPVGETRLLVSPDSRIFKKLRQKNGNATRNATEVKRLPLVTIALLGMVIIFAIPLFFALPRYGANAFTRSDSGLRGFVGFSDSVSLGDIGQLQQNDKTVMRVRIEGAGVRPDSRLYWRGVALDKYTGRGWTKTERFPGRPIEGSERNFFRIGSTDAAQKLVTQTFFMEPLDTPVLFAASRALAIQGALPFVRRDSEDALSSRIHENSRLTYKVYSEIETPDPQELRRDGKAYGEGFQRYLALPPETDPRIESLARRIITEAGAMNRYDSAQAIESYLQDGRNFSYTLDLKATGPDPLADFLFRVKAGHCEYFATAMVVMLRKLGIAARIVNGFQTGRYNDAAGAYTVSERDAHSWVEVYFPSSDNWVTFDPTPAAVRDFDAPTSGFTATVGKYAEALQLIWTEYFVSYDKQEQRQLATSLRGTVGISAAATSAFFTDLQKSIKSFLGEITGGSAGETSNSRAGIFTLVVLSIVSVWFLFRVRRMGLRRALSLRRRKKAQSIVEFYERMLTLLGRQGFVRRPDQTPLEFADSIGSPEAAMLTRLYNRVRFGKLNLNEKETREVELWLNQLEIEKR